MSPEGKQYHTKSKFDDCSSVASTSQAYIQGRLTCCDSIGKNSQNLCVKAKPFPMFHAEEMLRVLMTAYATKDSSLIQGSIARLGAKSIPS